MDCWVKSLFCGDPQFYYALQSVLANHIYQKLPEPCIVMLYYPQDPYMVYIYANIWYINIDGKCYHIWHTWILWVMLLWHKQAASLSLGHHFSMANLHAIPLSVLQMNVHSIANAGKPPMKSQFGRLLQVCVFHIDNVFPAKSMNFHSSPQNPTKSPLKSRSHLHLFMFYLLCETTISIHFSPFLDRFLRVKPL